MNTITPSFYRDKATAFLQKYETQLSLGFFLGGFAFDIFTLSEPDDSFSIIQQLVYLSIIGLIVCFEICTPTTELESPNMIRRLRLQSLWLYRRIIVHFILGSLLSLYSLFYFKSSSFFVSFAFLAVLFGLLIANELERFQNAPLPIRPALFVFCLFSFFSILVPLALGSVSFLTFTASLLAASLALFGMSWWLTHLKADPFILKTQLIRPGQGVLLFIGVFYLFGWIPPVPLAITEIGVYHKVEKFDGGYILSHENPWYRFWQSGDQNFKSQPGDKLYVYAQIYAPKGFDDSIFVHWYYYSPSDGWQARDRIPMQIFGGRRSGFRGFVFKQNFDPGKWKVAIETRDGREIGRIHAEVLKVDSSSKQRQFTTEQR